jgi:hypothetical protein
LRFSALFYTVDSHALVRIINYIQGIYPSQLQKLFEIKENIDLKYPFQLLTQKFKQKIDFSVGLPLFILFYKDLNPQWQSQVISILEKIFTGQQVPIDEIVRNISIKIREASLKSLNLRSLTQIVFLGLLLVEYLIMAHSHKQLGQLQAKGLEVFLNFKVQAMMKSSRRRIKN